MKIKNALLSTAAATASLFAIGATAQAATVTVKAGDTVSAIAADHNTTIDAIQQANHLKDVNLILVGQQLEVMVIALPRLQHRRLNKRPRHNHQLRLVKLKLNRAKLARPNQVKHKLANLLLRRRLKRLVQHQTIATMVLIVLLRLGLLVKNLVVHILLVTVNTSVSTN